MYIAEFPLVFVKQIVLIRLEKLFRMIKSLKPTNMKDLAWFYSFSYLDLDFYRASDMGKNIIFCVSIADYPLILTYKSSWTD